MGIVRWGYQDGVASKQSSRLSFRLSESQQRSMILDASSVAGPNVVIRSLVSMVHMSGDELPLSLSVQS